MGCLGLEKEGWFDPWTFLCLLKKNAVEMGTQYVTGEVVDFNFCNKQDIVIEGVEGDYQGIEEVLVRILHSKQNVFFECFSYIFHLLF